MRDQPDLLGLGSPRGPDFLPEPFRPDVPSRPPTPLDAPSPGPAPARVVVVAALVAALVGGASGVAAALLNGEAVAPPRPAAGPAASGWAEIAARVLPSVVSVETGRGNGSGFVIDAAGHILTNAHVVSGRSRVTVVFNDGGRAAARVVGSDAADDLAVLAVDGGRSPAPATLGRSAGVAVGDDVLAVGSPLGLAGTVTSGIVSAVDREVPFGEGGGTTTALQTDASINPGNSGGPLADARGAVIGVNTAILSAGDGGSIGIGFAIPIDRAARVAARIIRN
ncbi:serine protease [Spongiactinospora rosea]|uniref:Serine protease n=1 Tax=Spongiactinospora rosea TaxID=2248750 RepID=A0A366M3F1_9ACTN|nr:trypsin-like peptidase domain-containing protein [Spongiactinospora rosea]RBQ19962.1 serine protease [Spongiactinospora rosea]